MNNKILFLMMSIFFSACSVTNEFNVTKIGEEPKNYKERAIYVLPKTGFKVSIDIKKETYIPGPYRMYSERFLGLQDYITQPGTRYRISNVDVISYTEPDPEHYYSINLLEGNLNYNRFLDLSARGFVLDPKSVIQQEASMDLPEENLPMFPFTDLGVEQNLQEVTDTLYKTLITDTSYVRIPVVRQQEEAKTFEQKAEEAANLILKIRRRRFLSVSAKNTAYPERATLDRMIAEMNKLEKDYIELFTGKTVVQRYSKTFLIVPQSSNEEQSLPVARFSELKGLIDSDEQSGHLIVFDAIPLNKVDVLRQVSGSFPENGRSNVFYTRIPEVADISVRIESDVLYKSRESIFQFGSLIPIPAGI